MLPDTLVAADPVPLSLNAAADDRRRSHRTALLRRAGYTVVEAASASQAIGTVVHRAVTLALLDADLPECDVADLAETLQRMRLGIRVVVVSIDHGTRGRPPQGDTSTRDDDDAPLIHVITTAVRKEAGVGTERSPQVVTDVFGQIQGTSDSGARLLNGTPRGLFQRSLVTFFDGKREVWHDAVRRAARGERVHLSGRLRPKERRPVPVTVRIVSRAGDAGTMLDWEFDPG